MIKLTYAQLNDFNVVNALAKLASFSGFGVKVAYRIGRINTKIQQEQNTAKQLFIDKVLKPHALRDEKGDLTYWEEGTQLHGQPKIDPEKKKAYDDAFAEFLANEVTISWDPIPAEDIEKAGLSGRELVALEPVLAGLERLLTDAEIAPIHGVA